MFLYILFIPTSHDVCIIFQYSSTVSDWQTVAYLCMFCSHQRVIKSHNKYCKLSWLLNMKTYFKGYNLILFFITTLLRNCFKKAKKKKKNPHYLLKSALLHNFITCLIICSLIGILFKVYWLFYVFLAHFTFETR